MVRIHSRTVYHAPIKVAQTPDGAYAPSRVHDISPGGLCWETDDAAPGQRPTDDAAPGQRPTGCSGGAESPVFILTTRYQPGSFGLNAYRSYVAVVKWSKPAEKGPRGRFRAGAQIVSRSHGVFEDLHKTCDLCGALHPRTHLAQSAGAFLVCRACAKHLEGLSGDVLASIQRFASDHHLSRGNAP